MRAITGREAAPHDRALVTIVEREGSAPRGVGSKLLVWPDGRIVGTVGGGSFEYAVTRRAQALLASGRRESELFRAQLDADPGEPGMVCGGSLTAIIEVIEPGQQA